jgi:hypothetical protein
LESATTPTTQQRRRGLLFIGAASAAVGFALSLQMSLNANFVWDDLRLSGLQQGLLEMTRETCGITALAVLAALAGVCEPLVGAAMLLLLGLGLASYVAVPDFKWLILASLVWSMGFHVWLPLPGAMTLGLAEPGRAGHRLGQVQAAGAVGAGAGLAGGLVLHLLGMTARGLFVLAGAAAILGSAACLAIPRRLGTPGPRVVFRRRYGLFYVLSFVEGWRKQIFVAFAGFLLVRNYGTPLSTMLCLFIATQVICWVAAPWVGRLIDRVGERRVLTFYFGCLTAFFVGYATIPNPWVLYALFVLDSSFFVFAMALTTYANRIAPGSERTATLSMGVAMNHVAAITMPLVGGLVWSRIGYEWTFFIGAAVAALGIPAALRIPDGQVQPTTVAEPAGLALGGDER